MNNMYLKMLLKARALKNDLIYGVGKSDVRENIIPSAIVDDFVDQR